MVRCIAYQLADLHTFAGKYSGRKNPTRKSRENNVDDVTHIAAHSAQFWEA